MTSHHAPPRVALLLMAAVAVALVGPQAGSAAEPEAAPVSPLVRVSPRADTAYATGKSVTQSYRSLASVKQPLDAERGLTKEILNQSTPQFFAATLRDAELESRPNVALQIGKHWFVHQGLTHKGVPLAATSSISLMVRENGTPVFARERNIPARFGDMQPTVKAEAADALALEHAKRTERLVKLHSAKPELEVWVDGERLGHAAWKCEVASTSESVPFAQRMWISATGEPRVLAVENRIFHAHRVRVTGKAWDVSPLKEPRDVPLPNQEVELVKGGEVQMTATTDSRGEVSFPGFGEVEVRAKLAGMYCEVKDTGEKDLKGTQNGNDTRVIELRFAAANESQLAQITAFYWTNMAENFAHDILAGASQHPLAKLTTNVNIDDTCNAYWDGSSINFFRSGQPCPNTAYRGIVLHEYGHGIDDGIGGILDGGYSEGFGDAVAMLITHQPQIGEDFLGAGRPVRDARNVVKWPPDDPEVHYVGEIYTGFVWQLVQRLLKRYSEDEAYAVAKRLILSAAAANPSDIPDAVHLSFLADDDDDNLTNGSPHFGELAAAADSRTIPRPETPKGK